MIYELPIGLLDYDSEPFPILGGPLCLGYREYLAGNKDICREIVVDFLTSVYVSRPEERSTERFVHDICREKDIAVPTRKSDTDHALIRTAAYRRYDRLHLPIVESIARHGYLPGLGHPLTARQKSGRYLIGDGKNRSSILAALGRENVPNVRIEP